MFIELTPAVIACLKRGLNCWPQQNDAVGLEIKEILKQVEEAKLRIAEDVLKQRIEATLAQPEQEPLKYWNAVEGWVKIDEVREHFDSVGCGTIYKTAGEGREPLYTAPPPRTWVGLTEEEKYDCYLKIDVWSRCVEAVESKLKEKNT